MAMLLGIQIACHVTVAIVKGMKEMSSVTVEPKMANKTLSIEELNNKKNTQNKSKLGNQGFAKQLQAIMVPDLLNLVPTEISAPVVNKEKLNSKVIENKPTQANHSASETNHKSDTAKTKPKETVTELAITEHAAVVLAAKDTQIKDQKTETTFSKLDLKQVHTEKTEKYLLKDTSGSSAIFENQNGSVKIKLHTKPTTNLSNDAPNHKFSAKGADISSEVRRTMIQQQTAKTNISNTPETNGIANKFVPNSAQNIRAKPQKASATKPITNVSSVGQNNILVQNLAAQAIQATTRGAEIADKTSKAQQISNLGNDKKAEKSDSKTAKFETQRGASALDRARALKEITDTFKKMISDKTTKMTIHLKPDSLGEVKIKLEIADKTVTNVSVEALKDVNELLKNETQNFEKIIEEAGLSMESNMQFFDKDQQDPQPFQNEISGTELADNMENASLNNQSSVDKYHDGNVNVEV